MIGVIAQELLTTHPEMVASGSDGYLMVRQPSIWQLVKGIQELNARIDAQEGALILTGETPASPSLFAAILGWFRETLDITLERGLIRTVTGMFKKVVADELEIRDRATGQPYCITIVNGELDKKPGACDSILPEQEPDGSDSMQETPPDRTDSGDEVGDQPSESLLPGTDQANPGLSGPEEMSEGVEPGDEAAAESSRDVGSAPVGPGGAAEAGVEDAGQDIIGGGL